MTERAAAIATATATLVAAGIPEPRREALRLWRELGDVAAHEFQRGVARRAAGEPLAYVTGQAGFRHLVLATDARALIPRPETEQLVEIVLRARSTGRAADVGTGTGCIALSLATEGRFDLVVAVDSCRSALSLCAENRRRSGACSVELVHGDLTGSFAAASLDVLVSNPPYLTDGEWSEADPSVSQWEPSAALVSGPDGLWHTRRLLDEGRHAVCPGGLIALELDCRRAPQVARLAADSGWRNIQVIQDLFGRERYLLALRSEQP
ncbi:MAG TPA: peptide chain release factor N(5)-glutamine methyltransferase [Gemmatimonadales bacterium]|nr:peptide chain release factor N(5)-glutamine methyltransferase [Gemmatimonadales bacterium]